jgi:hypothetical protein
MFFQKCDFVPAMTELIGVAMTDYKNFPVKHLTFFQFSYLPNKQGCHPHRQLLGQVVIHRSFLIHRIVFYYNNGMSCSKCIKDASNF